jgi:glycosyltransferase involved in cell wall biosynthesis
MKNVLFVANKIVIGGVEKIIYELASGLCATEEPPNIFLLILEKGSYNLDRFEKLNVNIIYIDFFYSATNKWRLINSYYNLARFIQKNKYDTIVTFNRNTSIIFTLLKPFYKAKLIFRDSSSENYETTKTKYFLRFILNHLNIQVVQLSNEGKIYFCDHFKLFHNKVMVIHNGVEIITKPERKKANKSIHFIYIANFFPNKNHHFLIDVWIDLNSKVNTDIHLTLYGNDNGNDHLQSILCRTNVIGNIEVITNVNIESINLAAFDIGLSLSNRESFGNIILEYMNYELMIVATKTNGSVEILGRNYPFLIDPLNHDQLLQICIKTIRERNFLKFGEETKKNMIKRFDHVSFINNYKKII